MNHEQAGRETNKKRGPYKITSQGLAARRANLVLALAAILPLAERFWQRTKKGDACWEWTGQLHKHGYGFISKNRRMTLAHRVSWEIHNGAIPDRLHVLHRCDNRKCVRPDHLFLGTNADNVADKVAKGRCPKTVPGNQGERHAHARLTEAAVRTIRTSRDSNRSLAARYGVSKDTVRLARLGETWRHL